MLKSNYNSVIHSFQKDLLKNISAWLELLEEVAKNTTDTSGLPKLEVSLRSGKTFCGSVLGLKRSVDENLLMLSEEAEPQARQKLHLIQCEEISALSFIDPNVFLAIASNQQPVVSELEVKRKIKTIEDEIEQIVSARIPVSFDTVAEAYRSRALQLTETLPSIFSTLMSDGTGKELIPESISSIGIQVGKTAETHLNNKHLLCVFAKDSEVFLSKQKEALFHSIQKAL
jgi:hypothetical protein